MEANLDAMASPGAFKEDSPYRKALRAFVKNKVAFPSFVFLVGIVLATTFAGVLTPYDPYQGNIANRLQPVGASGHLLGTDEQGRDMLTRILYGGRLTLLAGFVPVVVSSLIGGTLGLAAGYFGGWLNTVIMRTLDIFYAFPAVILSLGISAALGQGMTNIIIAITIVFIPPVARVTETAVKRIRGREFIEAARSSGAGHLSIIRYQVVPNVFPQVFVFATTKISLGIVIAAGLSFLGLGVNPPTPEWGIMLNNIKQMIFVKPVLTIVPGIFLFLTSLTINLCSDGVSDAMQIKA
ncbi:ABC transporter permease [Paenibacillus sp. IB182496]|uniref:ABC transporter permease n=1 Tax=Paenibacillus sabuli TaxID=2772509 RepID=A0A927BWI8_9BACL|nr:ABC transporter permease [Paenibacillus sabuli]MBD2847040.1 ABC transporter permease [Paenibacillus sabuli]